MNKVTKRLAASGAAVALLLGATACSTIAEPDTVVLQYTGGSSEGTTFKECIPPASKGGGVVNDHNYILPASLRTWNIAPKGAGGDTDVPIVSSSLPSSDGQAGPKMAVYAKLEFYLNTNCGADDKDKNAPLPQFWERTGRRYSADTEGGWRKMLLNTLVPAELMAIKAEVKRYKADDLDANIGDIYDRIEVIAGQKMMTALADSVGGTSYFCGPSYRRGQEVEWEEARLDARGDVVTTARKGACPPLKIEISDIEYENRGIQEARDNVRKAQEQARAELIAAQSKVAQAEALAEANRNPQYLQFEMLERDLAIAREKTRQVELCAKNPTCTVIVSDGSAGVNIQGR